MDVTEQVPEDFTYVAIPNNKLAPNLAKRGIYAVRYPRADASLSYFGMDDPVVGGYSAGAGRAAARHRARGRRRAGDPPGPARPGDRRRQSLLPPGVSGYDAAFKSEMSEFDPARAKALLDLYGYVDRDGDGWREQPDGSPLQIEYATQPDGFNRQLVTQWKKNMDAIGIRMVFRNAQWPENLKASRAGKLQMWGVGESGGPDGCRLPRARLRQERGPGQPGALRAARVRPALRAAEDAARRSRARRGHDRGRRNS